MTIEMLILSVCLGGSGAGCQKIGEAYYSVSGAKEKVHQIETNIEKKYDMKMFAPVFFLGNAIVRKQVVVTLTF